MHRLAAALALAVLTAGAAHARSAGDRYGPSAPVLRGGERLPGAASDRWRLISAGEDAGLRGRAPSGPVAIPPTPKMMRLARRPAPAPQPMREAAPTPPASRGDLPDPPSRAPPAPRLLARQYGAGDGRSTARPGSYAPQRPRRYSVGREFGVEPDPIPLPDPTEMAFSPEVGAAFAAHNDRQSGADDSVLSPADKDQIEQANQDDGRREARQKARDKAAAARR